MNPDPPRESDPTILGEHLRNATDGENPGGFVGPFRILGLIGEGGFGSVFEAEQEHPVRRHVALKVIKLGMDTREVIARFEAERQVLALMDHPHIARVLDAGATESGRPYFVMELVRGEPITRYCSEHRLPIEQRLELFEQVCAAVQHAHSKGIIHRDLKPNNVLVSTQDGRAYSKVIDFGIAKATSGRLTDRTMYTEVNLMMGTPLYMSPEQAEGSPDIDTRTDIYSLGVILYELLTDTTPLDSSSLRSAAYAEVQRIIREVEPLRPSARLTQSVITRVGGEPGPQFEPRKWVKRLRGELDWIAMKAIEKERSRRYETAAALAADVRRYLTGEAVLAAPPGLSYRMGKFVRRHKGTVAAGSLVAGALLAGIAGFAWQARIAQQEARFAQQQAQLARQQALLAQKSEKDLVQVANFEANMLGQVNPIQAGKLLSDNMRSKYEAALARANVPQAERARQLASLDAIWQRVNATDTARDMIDNTILKPAVVAIDKQFRQQPLVDAFLRQTLATRYTKLGLVDAAMPLQQSALATRRHILGEGNADTLESMLAMSNLLDQMGKSAEAEPLARQAMQGMRRVWGEDDPRTLNAMSLLGLLLYNDGRLDEAEPYYREVLAIERRVLGEANPQTISQIHGLGLLLMYRHKLAEAEPLLREAAQKMQQLLGDEDQGALLAKCNLGYLLEREGRLDEAESLEREAIGKARHALGDDHPVTLVATTLTGMVLEKKGEHMDAEKLLAPIEATVRKTFSGSRAFVAATYLTQLGRARTGVADYAAAETNLLAAYAIFEQTHNVTHADDLRDCAQALVALYAAWDKGEPKKGHDASAAGWKKKLDALGVGPARG